MQITLESTVFDPVGVISLEALPGSDLSASTRRVTRTATLDGQAVIIDNGYTSADSTLAIEAALTEAEAQQLHHLMQTYPEIIAIFKRSSTKSSVPVRSRPMSRGWSCCCRRWGDYTACGHPAQLI